ncbi:MULTISPECIES: arsenic transporter [Metabacillus]|uniref:Arsenic transporter n=1 Tax=Metabacillus rhizolycopersici TaxID=2875709 RepID=A0ABS7USR4_9BACI|nr:MULTISPECIES: arsenic transporter [Metabacillus]MBZ5751038.1 arsenic transporter [Metabacillus rhizolycopersici]MCM3651849.1 arsenic transporter [Metabacillus litoralis]
MSFEIGLTILVFVMTMFVIFWRPGGLNEAWPASVGAGIILITGIVSQADVADIISKIGGASITIIATIVMAVILESFGFFHWAAARLATLSKGSGYRLYWYIQLLCFSMTLLFNNDGSILITTPILILLLKSLRLKPHQMIPYLLSGALIATASSAPIGVSNIINLIVLQIIDMSLYMYTAMMFVPATLGLLFMAWLMFVVIKKKLPKKLPATSYDIEEIFFTENFHPLKGKLSVETRNQRTRLMMKVLLFVFVMRCLLFVASYFAIPIELVAVLGSVVLLVWRWYYLRTNPIDILKKPPWHILIFAFSMYVIIYGLHNAGLTAFLVESINPIVNQGLLHASFIMGGLVSILSNIFNNHPALMIGTITLTEMGLDPITLKTIYLANIIGSDMGSLLLPIGTLASLIWMHILRENKIKIKWKDYLRVSIPVIPLTTVVTLFLLFYWVQMVFT